MWLFMTGHTSIDSTNRGQGVETAGGGSGSFDRSSGILATCETTGNNPNWLGIRQAVTAQIACSTDPW